MLQMTRAHDFPQSASMTNHARISAIQIETVSGLLAGTISTLIVHPLDVIKTRLQVQRSASSARIGTLTILQGLVQRDQPIQRLYRGLTPNLVGNASSWAVFFCCKTIVEDRLLRYRLQRECVIPRRDLPAGQPRDLLMPIDYFCASGISGAIITLSTNPIWVLKTRMLSSDKGHAGAYQSMWHGASQIMRKEGLWGFYKGIGVSLLGNSHGAVQFSVYEPLKKVWRQMLMHNQPGSTASFSEEKLGITATLVISGSAKIIAGTVTYPLQVLRSRMQAHHSEHVFGKGIVQVAQKVWADQGWRGFYKGLGVNTARVLPATWVTFLVYENSKYYMSAMSNN